MSVSTIVHLLLALILFRILLDMSSWEKLGRRWLVGSYSYWYRSWSEASLGYSGGGQLILILYFFPLSVLYSTYSLLASLL